MRLVRRFACSFAVLVCTAAFGPVLDRCRAADEPPPAEKPAAETPPAPEKPAPEKPAAEKPAPDKPSTEKPSGGRPDDAEFFELLRLFTDTLDQIDRNYVKDVSRRELMEAAIRGMMTKLDPYSNYIPPEEMEGFRGGIENEFGGIGIQVAIDGGKLTVISPLVGSPAYRAGVQAGDWIRQIDGTLTRGMTLDDAVKKMKGKLGTEVVVTVVRARDGRTDELTLKRETIKVETVLGDRRHADDAWDYLLDPDAKIGYLRITSFGRSTTADVEKAIKQLVERQLRGLVIDLRFNPGGLLSSAIEISDLFVAEGRIVSTSGKNAPERVVKAVKAGTYEDFPVVVLVNRYSASASEIVAACLQDHGRAVVIGERTWGKGSVQNIVELEEGRSAIKLTTAGYLRPNGKNIHRFEGATEDDDWGVRPDQGFEIKLEDDELGKLIEQRRARDVVRPPAEDAESSPAEFVDRQLQAGLDLLRKKLAPPPADTKPAEAKPADPTAEKTPEKPADGASATKPDASPAP